MRLLLWLVVVPAVLGLLAWVACLNAMIDAKDAMLAEQEAQVAAVKRDLEEERTSVAAREAEFAERAEVLRRREAAIGGREDAANDRTQSSFQGLMIQQQLIKNLQALKASLPDMTPEVEKLAKEHAQLTLERERLAEELEALKSRSGKAPEPPR